MVKKTILFFINKFKKKMQNKQWMFNNLVLMFLRILSILSALVVLFGSEYIFHTLIYI